MISFSIPNILKGIPILQMSTLRLRTWPEVIGNGNPLQYSCLENPMDREDWQATAQGVAKSRTQLSGRAYVHMHACGKLYV